MPICSSQVVAANDVVIKIKKVSRDCAKKVRKQG